MSEDQKKSETDPITENLGGVQGSEGDTSDEKPVGKSEAGTVLDQLAPDAGEIEWAGGVIKKPPTPKR